MRVRFTPAPAAEYAGRRVELALPVKAKNTPFLRAAGAVQVGSIWAEYKRSEWNQLEQISEIAAEHGATHVVMEGDHLYLCMRVEDEASLPPVLKSSGAREYLTAVYSR